MYCYTNTSAEDEERISNGRKLTRNSTFWNVLGHINVYIVRFLSKTTMTTVAAIFERSNKGGFYWRREKKICLPRTTQRRDGGGVQSSWVWWLHHYNTYIYIRVHIQYMCLPVVLLLLLYRGPAAPVVEHIYLCM